MIVTACLTLLFLSDFRTGEGDSLPGATPVTAAMLPLPTAFLPPSHAALDRESAEPIVLASISRVAFGAPEPDSQLDSEPVGPTRPDGWPTVVERASREIPTAAIEAVRRTAAVDDEPAVAEFVGPPAPARPTVAQSPSDPPSPHNFSYSLAANFLADDRQAEDDGAAGATDPASAESARLELDAVEFDGPPRPLELARADADAASAHDGRHTAHGLPFDPLAVGPFRVDAPAPEQQPKRDNPFASFLASQNDLHTVEYTRELHHKIRSGETISEVLADLGLDALEIDQWVRAAAKQHSLNRIYAGQEVALLVHGPKTQLLRLQLEVNSQHVLVAERTPDGVSARLQEIEYEDGLRVAGAEIEHSLYMAAQSQAVPDSVISEMAEILGWDINLGRELIPGSTFRVVYEERTRVDTGEVIPGRVLAVDLINRGKKYEGYYFRMPDGTHAGYYDRKGESLGRAFLRYPVAFSRISSAFTTKRFHPVLKRNIPHYGVDFAAATGTPVRAVADGKVLKAGWYGGNGRFVKLRHDSVYESGYAHLSRVASSVREGGSVKKGQIIGYVGSTGLATGPHLHFAMYRYGKYIDPLHTKLPRTQSLAGSSLAAFRMTVDMMDRAYARAERDKNGRPGIRTAAAVGAAPSR